MFWTLGPILKVVSDLNAVIILEARQSFGDHFEGHCPVLGHGAKDIALQSPAVWTVNTLVLDRGRVVVNEDADTVEVEPVLTPHEADH